MTNKYQSNKGCDLYGSQPFTLFNGLGADRLTDRYLVDTALMAASFEFSVEKSVDNVDGYGRIDETSGEYKHIGVVVFAGESGECCAPAQTVK